MLADRQALAAEQKALIAQLEENMAAARDSLLIALERKRILANQQAAILAVIETFY
jgi:hypothetical protein